MSDLERENQPETYIGPCSLREALDAAEPNSEGIRMAVSTPQGDLVAIEAPGFLYIRRANRISGRTGSVMDTGQWLDGNRVLELLNGRGQWRPA